VNRRGHRSEFGKIVSLDYGDPELLRKFQKIYRVNEMPPEKAHQGRLWNRQQSNPVLSAGSVSAAPARLSVLLL